MRKASRSVTFINTSPLAERVELLKPLSEIENLSDDCEEILSGGLLRRYIERPECMQNITLADWAAWYDSCGKKARVTPISKKGKKNDLNNYRPISGFQTVAKILEKNGYEQLFSYFNDNNLLTFCQSGFRSFHSTLTALTEATNSWSVNIDNGLLNGIVFLDLKKAFDTIDHSIILRKLQFYGIEQESLRWFQSYLDDRKQVCCVNGHMSICDQRSYGGAQLWNNLPEYIRTIKSFKNFKKAIQNYFKND